MAACFNQKCSLLIGVVLLLFSGAIEGREISAIRCPTYWTTWGEHCYRYFSYETHWYEAESMCNMIGVGGGKSGIGHLVSIHSQEEQNFVYTMFKSYTAGINVQRDLWFPQLMTGLMVGEDVNDSSWSDGTPVDYFNLFPGEPNFKNTSIVISDGDGKRGLWIDNYGYHLRPFMCKIPQS